jgi:hypothetical protein
MALDRDYSTGKQVKNVILFFMIFIVVSCTNKPPRYGAQFNSVRSQIGLPVLPENWILNKVSRTGSEWINPQKDLSKPFHRFKTIVYNDDTVLWESDQYNGPGFYKTIDGKFREELYITYNFTINESSIVGWECALFCEETIGRGSNEKITKFQADSVLISWGIKRE